MNDRQPTFQRSWTPVLILGGLCALVFLLLVVTGLFEQFRTRLSQWSFLDTWIVLTAGLAAMACALPGVFLVLRRQSMMGDALSHTVLPGIAIAFIITHGLLRSGAISLEDYQATQHAALFGGAMIVGVLAAVLTEAIQKLGKVESSASLGVVFTILFAAGLLMIKIAADKIHLDPDCVLYGNDAGVPEFSKTAVVGSILAVNLVLVIVFFKELRISAFDPNLATTVGINARLVHYALMGVTAATLVAAFEVVGSILVIAMLIAPAATAYLLTDRLDLMIVLSLTVAGLSALLGHALAITLPAIIFGPLGYETVQDASTAGMMAFATGLLFVGAMLFSPRHGVISKLIGRLRLALRIATEDILGFLYRLEEKGLTDVAETSSQLLKQILEVGPVLQRMAMHRLARGGLISADAAGYCLTPAGRDTAKKLVRSHRLWESYMAKHFELPSTLR